jgi:hypothetical protein
MSEIRPLEKEPPPGTVYYVVTEQKTVIEVAVNAAGQTPSPHIARHRAFATKGEADFVLSIDPNYFDRV